MPAGVEGEPPAEQPREGQGGSESSRSRPLYRRREALGVAAGGAAALALGGAFWAGLFAGDPPPRRRFPAYGPLRPPDRLGIRLPERFSARLVAEGGRPVAGSGYRWHEASDGAGIFGAGDGGWILVSNSEVPEGGASAVRFSAKGVATDAYRVLEGTTMNCSGGATTWGTWLSCEEVDEGRVWECDPAGRRPGRVRPAMGVFKHEAAAVDPAGRRVYMTEDLDDGALYRFTPERWPDLSAGTLEVAVVERGGAVRWRRVPDPSARRRPTRRQVARATPFARGEGIWFDSGTVYVATTSDSRVHAYDTRRERIDVIYDGLASQRAPVLKVDQLTASPAGEIFVCEDSDRPELSIGVMTPGRAMTRFLTVTGPEHDGSELTGVAFDPSGSRMYFASQRARDSGVVYELTGPFRRRA